MHPRASRMATTSGFSFFSTPLASTASRILRATSRVSSAMSGFLWLGRGRGGDVGAVEAHRQHARNVERVAAGAVLDLVPAGSAVGTNECRGIGAPHRRQ